MELLCITIAWLLGIITGLYFKIGIALFCLAILIIYILRKKNKFLKVCFQKRYLILLIVAHLISFMQITYLEEQFEMKYANTLEEIKVVGTIISNGSQKQYSTSYTLKVESINGDTSYKDTKLLLKVKKEKRQKTFAYGNKISFLAEFEKPSKQRNEGGFNYEQYLKTKQIYGIVTTKAGNITLQKENNANFIFKLTNTVSNQIQQKANELLEKEEASLLTGILIGDKENIEDEVQEAFRKSNLSHMLAVSGAHVSYIMLGIHYLMTIGKIGKRKSKIVTIFLLLFFILLTGQTSSVTRACFMTIYLIIAQLLHKRVSTISSISISMLILMILNPYSILEVGFQLSYGGTLGIVLIYKKLKQYTSRKVQICEEDKEALDQKQKNMQKMPQMPKMQKVQKIKQSVQEMLLITISANLILMPIILYHYNTLSLTFLISNLLAAPIMGIVVISGFLTIITSFVLPFVAKILAVPLRLLLKIFLQIAILTSNLPFSQIKVITPKISFILFYYFIVALLIFKQNKRRWEKKKLKQVKKVTIKKQIAILLIIISFGFILKQIPKPLKINFIDVGQGDSTLVTTPNGKTLLIDGGGSKDTESFDVGEDTLIPYLLDKGISKLDYVLISHFDADHVGGILTLLQEMKVEKVIISKQGEDSQNYNNFKKIVKEKRIKVIVVKQADELTIDKNVILHILWPKEEQIKENILNNNSIVAKLTYNSLSMLFTGDIEQIAEEKIIQEYKNTAQLKATILKVAHHGSKSSSIQEFLEQVKPKIALIGVGEKNTFGHPNSMVIERLQNLRSQSL